MATNKIFPHLNHEIELWKKGFQNIIGIDEVGRGAFAGPLCVAGVIFSPCHNDKNRLLRLLELGINDSKKLTAKRRELLAKVIQKEAHAFYISTISVDKIDQFGVGEATFMGMREVVKNLREKANIGNYFVLTDAFKLTGAPGVSISNQLNIIRGDSISLSIAAASIIAKVYRDSLMNNLSEEFPEYKFEENKGYGTLYHRNKIKNIGLTEHHRTSFIH